MANLFHLGEGHVLVLPSLRKKENQPKNFTANFFSVAPPSWLYTYPIGLKRQKAALSLTYYWTNANRSKMGIRFLRKKKKKHYPLIDNGKVPRLIWSMLLISSSNTVNHGSKLVFFMLCFHVTVPLTKKPT